MKSYKENQTVHIIESDGIALGHYAGYSQKKNGHKVRTSTSSSDYKVVKDALLESDYQNAKKKLLSSKFRNQHFKNS